MGRAADHIEHESRTDPRFVEEAHHLEIAFQFLTDPLDLAAITDLHLGYRNRVGGHITHARNRVAVRTGLGVAHDASKGSFDVLGDHVLPQRRLGMDLDP